MNSAAFALALATLRLAVREYGWSRKRSAWHGESRTITRASYCAALGRFEGEHWSLVHWFDAMLNGDFGETFCGADGNVECEVFEPDATERAAFGIARKYVVLEYSSQGFVTMAELGEGALKELREHYANTNTEDF